MTFQKGTANEQTKRRNDLSRMCISASAASLLLRQVADDRQLEQFVLIRLDHQQYPQKKPRQADQSGQRKHQHSHERDQLHQRTEYSSHNPEHESSRPQKQMLNCMKAHEEVSLERL